MIFVGEIVASKIEQCNRNRSVESDNEFNLSAKSLPAKSSWLKSIGEIVARWIDWRAMRSIGKIGQRLVSNGRIVASKIEQCNRHECNNRSVEYSWVKSLQGKSIDERWDQSVRSVNGWYSTAKSLRNINFLWSITRNNLTMLIYNIKWVKINYVCVVIIHIPIIILRF